MIVNPTTFKSGGKPELKQVSFSAFAWSGVCGHMENGKFISSSTSMPKQADAGSLIWIYGRGNSFNVDVESGAKLVYRITTNPQTYLFLVDS